MSSTLLKNFCIVQIVFFLNSVETVIPSATNVALKDTAQLSRSRSSSSSSSTASLTSKHQHLEERNLVASTSKLKKNRINQQTRLDETEPLTHESSRSILNEASVQTNVPFSELNPSRDGFFARTNRVLAKHAVSTFVGTAVGFAVDEMLHRMNSTSTTITTTTTTPPSTTTEENILVEYSEQLLLNAFFLCGNYMKYTE